MTPFSALSSLPQTPPQTLTVVRRGETLLYLIFVGKSRPLWYCMPSGSKNFSKRIFIVVAYFQLNYHCDLGKWRDNNKRCLWGAMGAGGRSRFINQLLFQNKILAKIKPFHVTCTQQLNVLRREALRFFEWEGS